MSTAGSWHFNRKRLAEVLSRWMATGPEQVTRTAVNDALMDLLADPLSWGLEDPQEPGVYHRQVMTETGVRVAFLYAMPDPASGEVGIADIRTV